jgi:hypothetical protein
VTDAKTRRRIARPVTWGQGTKTVKSNPEAAMTSHFVAIRVRPANRDIPRAADGTLPGCWLLAEWPPSTDEPTGYWLAPPRHPGGPGSGLLHHDQGRPRSPCAGMTLYQVLHELQIVLALILGACPLCRQPVTLDRLAAALTTT